MPAPCFAPVETLLCPFMGIYSSVHILAGNSSRRQWGDRHQGGRGLSLLRISEMYNLLHLLLSPADRGIIDRARKCAQGLLDKSNANCSYASA